MRRRRPFMHIFLYMLALASCLWGFMPAKESGTRVVYENRYIVPESATNFTIIGGHFDGSLHIYGSGASVSHSYFTARPCSSEAAITITLHGADDER